jgi:hypothetical protein
MNPLSHLHSYPIPRFSMASLSLSPYSYHTRCLSLPPIQSNPRNSTINALHLRPSSPAISPSPSKLACLGMHLSSSQSSISLLLSVPCPVRRSPQLNPCTSIDSTEKDRAKLKKAADMISIVNAMIRYVGRVRERARAEPLTTCTADCGSECVGTQR